MKVGQTIYGYHSNNNNRSYRSYSSQMHGRDRDYPELPVGWNPYEITGKTKQSWVLFNRCSNIKRVN